MTMKNYQLTNETRHVDSNALIIAYESINVLLVTNGL